ncbi:MAG: CCA tRNA nucleotidyltransferase [Chloroflexota bacterium]
MNHEAAVRAAIPEDVATLMGQLHSAGYAAFVVGGAIRDIAAGRAPEDWDLATDATPEQLRTTFPNAEYENRFGTVGIPTLVAMREVTTFRSDGPSSDARRPDAVTFLDAIEGDLARRDFTVNAMAFGLPGNVAGDPVISGTLVDPFGGAKDLAAGLLRAVGNPEERFREDALRMLRAARFVTRFGLSIEPETAAAARQNAALASTLSGERIGAEIEGILAAERPAQGISALRDLGLLVHVAPEMNVAWVPELPERVAALGTGVGTDSLDLIGRLAELLSVISDDATAERVLTAWRRPRATLHAIAALRQIDRSAASAERGEIDAAMYRIQVAAQSGDPQDAARQLRRRIATGRALPSAATLLSLCERADENGVPAQVSDLLINGSKLLEHVDSRPGPWMKTMLDELLKRVAQGHVENRAEPLIAVAKLIHEAG